MHIQMEGSQNATLISEMSVAGQSSAIAYTGECVFHGILIQTDGTNNITFSVHSGQNAGASLLLIPDIVVLGSARLWSLSISPPLHCPRGIYIDFTVAGAGTGRWQVNYSSR